MQSMVGKVATGHKAANRYFALQSLESDDSRMAVARVKRMPGAQ